MGTVDTCPQGSLSLLIMKLKLLFVLADGTHSVIHSHQHPSRMTSLGAHMLSLGVLASRSHGLMNICSCFLNHNVATATKNHSYDRTLR